MPDHELLDEVARALTPGPVEPPAGRIRALRTMVKASAAASANGEVGATDGTLIDDIARALRVGPVEPPAERVRAVRELVTAEASGHDEDAEELNPVAPVADLDRARTRREAAGRLSRMVSGMFAAAAVGILVAMVAVTQLPGALREVAHDVGLPVDSPELVAATHDIDRLQLALVRRDAKQVAEADAAMLRSTNKLDGEDLEKLQQRAERLHVEALAFLRDNPSPDALSELPTPVNPVTGEPFPPGQAAPPPPGSAEPSTAAPPLPPSGSTAQPPTPPTTVAPQPRTVRILSVIPRLDASFQVDFEVSGFTLGPGQPYTVQFFFDADKDVSTYSGPSPWKFPLLNAVKYHTVCAQVADASGVRDPSSGNCKPILLI